MADLRRMDGYSRLIAALKVILPLLALAILSTLFLLSRSVEPGRSIPFADAEIADRLRTEQVTGPFFSTTTTDGDRLTITASSLATSQTTENTVEDLAARIDLVSGGSMSLRAEHGTFDLPANIAELIDGVRVQSSTGYDIRTDRLRSSLSSIDVTAPGPVSAVGPVGTLDAGGMQITADPESGKVRLVFTGGVKLIYTPEKEN